MSPRFIASFLMIGCLACARTGIRQEPAAGACFQTISIRFNFSDLQGRQNGRIHWRFDRLNAKFLFFTPLNQVGLELDVKGETALLLRPGKKLYWRGDFSVLLDRLWGIELTMEELKKLLLEGLIPEAKMKEKGIAIELEPDPKNNSPQKVRIRRNDVDLTIKILQSASRSGSIVFLDYDQRFQPAELEDLLSDD